jgi:hypothetical protein
VAPACVELRPAFLQGPVSVCAQVQRIRAIGSVAGASRTTTAAGGMLPRGGWPRRLHTTTMMFLFRAAAASTGIANASPPGATAMATTTAACAITDAECASEKGGSLIPGSFSAAKLSVNGDSSIACEGCLVA